MKYKLFFKIKDGDKILGVIDFNKYFIVCYDEYRASFVNKGNMELAFEIVDEKYLINNIANCAKMSVKEFVTITVDGYEHACHIIIYEILEDKEYILKEKIIIKEDITLSSFTPNCDLLYLGFTGYEQIEVKMRPCYNYNNKKIIMERPWIVKKKLIGMILE